MKSSTTQDKTLVVVMAHGGAQEIYNRHLPFWQSHNCPLLTFCPVDDKVVGPGKIIAHGPKGHHDAWSLDRFKWLLKLLSVYPFDYFMIHEYDSLCLTPQIPEFLYEKEALWSNLFSDAPGGRFKGYHFTHPPLFMGKHVLRRLVRAGEMHQGDTEDGFWDRWVGLMCEKASIRMKNYGPLGFAWNTIEPHLIPHARQASIDGAIFIHGVKSVEALGVFTEER